LSSHPRQRKGKQRKSRREGERVGVSPGWVPKGRRPQPGLPSSRKCPNRLARLPHAKQWVPQWAGEAYLVATTSGPGRAGSPNRRVTLTESEE
jgi:hypothetical protein